MNYRTTVPGVMALFFATILGAQPKATTGQDTLFFQNFESAVDPGQQMRAFPSGHDEEWVNYDADGADGLCISGPDGPPTGWFWESDLSTNEPNDNYAFTSCSWLDRPVRTMNWLITPPIFIPDDEQTLFWRSLSLQGPAYHDGYKVLVSTGSNIPESEAFADTLFQQAEMIAYSNNTSLNPADFLFSNGYIHAKTYTDTAFFFLDTFVDNNQQFPFLHGRLEPHSVSLEKYAGNWVFIAFLHDSRDDYMVQVDDITVLKRQLVSAQTPDFIRQFELFPNPSSGEAWVYWSTQHTVPNRFFIANSQGQVVWTYIPDGLHSGTQQMLLPTLPTGVYRCVLQTPLGTTSKTLLVQSRP